MIWSILIRLLLILRSLWLRNTRFGRWHCTLVKRFGLAHAVSELQVHHWMWLFIYISRITYDFFAFNLIVVICFDIWDMKRLAQIMSVLLRSLWYILLLFTIFFILNWGFCWSAGWFLLIMSILLSMTIVKSGHRPPIYWVSVIEISKIQKVIILMRRRINRGLQDTWCLTKPFCARCDNLFVTMHLDRFWQLVNEVLLADRGVIMLTHKVIKNSTIAFGAIHSWNLSDLLMLFIGVAFEAFKRVLRY